MRTRLVVVAAFLALAAVPAWIAWHTGLVPGPTRASAETAGVLTTSSAAVTPLVWPKDPLSLAAGDDKVYWEQRSPDGAVTGLWYYDVTSGSVERLLSRQSLGRSSGLPVAAGDIVAWTSWAGRRGAGASTVQAYDGLSSRRWQVASTGSTPAATAGIVVWTEPGASARGGDTIHGVDSLTDEEWAVDAGGRVRALAASGRRLAWITAGKTGGVWSGSLGSAARHRLAARGAAVAVDRDRIVWVTPAGRHSSAVVSWDRSSQRATVLCRPAGASSALTLDGRYAAWVTTPSAGGPQVWVYDFGLGKAYRVSTAAGRQESPVIVAGSVYWAGDRTGHWELYSRSLQR